MKLTRGLSLFLAVSAVFAQTPNWTKQTPATLPNAVEFPAMAYDSMHQQVVLIGGFLRSGSIFYEYNGTWLWDGTAWTKKTPALSPQPRDGHVMAYDSVRNQVVLFGGNDTNGFAFGDTWTWDGTTWTLLTPAVSPAARYNATMAFDAVHGVMVLFGGYDQRGTVMGDMWTWNGTTWAQIKPTVLPGSRTDAVMTFDSIRNQIVMFGGVSLTAVLNDTWTWDGTAWTSQNLQTSPAPRAYASMAFDTIRGQAVLYGGLDVTKGYNDTWAWNGKTWTLQTPATIPNTQYGSAMAYDGARQQIVMFGGQDAATTYNETWTWPAAGVVVAPPPVVIPPPVITKLISASGFGGSATVSPGDWIEIYGTNLAPDTRSWAGGDFSNGGLTAPTTLDTVKVTVGGQSAAVAYISPTQLNVQVPSNIGVGTLPVIVTNGTVSSAASNVTAAVAQPGLLAPATFSIGGNQYVVALLPDNATYIIPTGVIAGVTSRPAHVGETIIIYGVGFGATTPFSASGQVTPAANQLSSAIQFAFNGVPATTTYAGLAPGFVGLYQFNVVVPAVKGATNSDLIPLTFTLGGVAGTQTLYTAVQQ